MKLKKGLLIIIMLISMFIGSNSVYATDNNTDRHNHSAAALDKGTELLVCEYKNSAGESIEIYNVPGSPTAGKIDKWKIYFSYDNGKWSQLYGSDDKNGVGLTFDKTFISGDRFHFNNLKTKFTSSNETNFSCPKKAYLDRSNYDEICLSSGEVSCGDNSGTKWGDAYDSQTNRKSIYSKIDEQVRVTLFSNKSELFDFNTITEDNFDSVYDTIKQKTIKTVKYDLFESKKMIVPAFVEGYMNNNVDVSDYANQKISEYKNKVEDDYKNERITEEEYNRRMNILNTVEDKVLPEWDGPIDTSVLEHYQDDFSSNCKSFARVLHLLGEILLIAEILIPLIIIVRSSFNLFSVVTKGTPEELKSQFSKLGISIVAGVSIFLVPSLVDAAVGVFTNSTYNSDTEICRACIFHPNTNACEDYIK